MNETASGDKNVFGGEGGGENVVGEGNPNAAAGCLAARLPAGEGEKKGLV